MFGIVVLVMLVGAFVLDVLEALEEVHDLLDFFIVGFDILPNTLRLVIGLFLEIRDQLIQRFDNLICLIRQPATPIERNQPIKSDHKDQKPGII